MADDTLPDDPAERKRAKERQRHKRRYTENPDYFKQNAARWAKENPERVRESQRAYAARNRERINAKSRERYDPERSRAYQAANKEHLREYHRDYHKKNAEALRAKTRAWTRNNYERKKQANKEYYIKNMDRIKAQQKAYADKNKEALSVYIKLWRLSKLAEIRDFDRRRYRANPGPAKTAASARAARLKDAVKALSQQAAADIKEFYKHCPNGMHVDHIVPLKPCVDCGAKGAHELNNLQYLDAEENQAKSNRCAECWNRCVLRLIKRRESGEVT